MPHAEREHGHAHVAIAAAGSGKETATAGARAGEKCVAGARPVRARVRTGERAERWRGDRPDSRLGRDPVRVGRVSGGFELAQPHGALGPTRTRRTPRWGQCVARRGAALATRP
eukprot:4353028-Prymnesium_polylepis.2